MIFHPKVNKICNFTEACKWIAFGWKPTELIYKFTDASLLDENGNPNYKYIHDKNYLKGIKFASYKLILAIYERRIAAIGTRLYPLLPYEKETDNKKHIVKLKKGGIPDFSIKGIRTVELSEHEYDYKDVIMNFKSLQKCFPRDENGNPIVEEAKQKKIGYNSLYMEIMDKVIDDLSITEKNQPSKKSIYYHVLAKYAKKYNLSNNTVQMIASLVLNPESKLGKAKK